MTGTGRTELTVVAHRDRRTVGADSGRHAGP